MPVHYDPLLAKLTAVAESRDAAIARARAALEMFPILGIRTNVPFLIRVLDHPDFRSGRLHTGFIEQHAADLLASSPAPLEALAAAAAAGAVAPPTSSPTRPVNPDPWTIVRRWGR